MFNRLITGLFSMSGTVERPFGKETYYNMNMPGIVSVMKKHRINAGYWVRGDRVKYVLVAGDLDMDLMERWLNHLWLWEWS